MANLVALPARLDRASVVDLHHQLDQAKGHDLTIDATNTTHIGALAAQLLLAASRFTADAGHQFCFANMSERVAGQIAAIGLPPAIFTKEIE